MGTIRRSQDNPRPECKLLGDRMASHEPPKLLALAICKFNRRRFGTSHRQKLHW
jgi:hypothetical protein